MTQRAEWGVYGVIIFALALLFIILGTAASVTIAKAIMLPNYYWPLSLFFLTLAIGVLAPMAGVGGGVIFVPLVSALYPFHVDFVRGTGLIMAFTSALAAAPKFLRTGLASLRIALPVVVIASATSILGAIIGLYITAAFPQGKYYVLTALGGILFFIFAIMFVRRVEFPEVKQVDGTSRVLRMAGAYFEPTLNKLIEYKATRVPIALLAFAGVGFLAGMFGLGAGWANVPVLNLVMSLPIKVSTSTSILIITMTDATASWIYLAQGAILPLLVVPAVAGMYIGSRVGAVTAVKARPRVIRYIFLGIMLFAAVMDIYKGLHGLGYI